MIKPGDRFEMPIGVVTVNKVHEVYAEISYTLPSGAMKREMIEIRRLQKCKKL